MKIYILPSPDGVVRNNNVLTLTYRVRTDASVEMSIDRSVSRSGDRATRAELEQAAFADALRFEEAQARADALSTWIGVGQTISVPNSEVKVRFDSAARTVNEPSIDVQFAILSAADVVISGPMSKTFANLADWTRVGLKKKAFEYARGVEVATSTADTISTAQGTEITVQ
jgi:hypothetical protein